MQETKRSWSKRRQAALVLAMLQRLKRKLLTCSIFCRGWTHMSKAEELSPAIQLAQIQLWGHPRTMIQTDRAQCPSQSWYLIVMINPNFKLKTHRV